MSSEAPPNSFNRTEAERGRLGKRHSRGKRFRRNVMVGALALGALYGVASMAYPVVKGIRAQRLARQSAESLAAGKLVDAQKLIRSAIRLAPHEPEVVRAAARYATKARSADAFKYWLEFADSPNFNDQDRIELIGAALSLDRLDLVQRFLHPLLLKLPRNREVLRLVVLEQAEFQNYPKAIEAARLALSIDPTSNEDLLTLGRLLLKSSLPSDRDEGKIILWEIALGKSGQSTPATAALVDAKALNSSELEVLLKRIQVDPHPTATQKMMAAGFEIQLHPDRRRAAMDQVLAEFESASPETRAVLMRWALKIDPARTADFLGLDRVGTNRILLTIRAEALADAGQWRVLDSLLTNTVFQIEPVGRSLLKARSALAQGKTEAGRGYLLDGINSANSDPRALILLAKTAEAANLPGDAIRAWERLSENPGLIVQASREIMRLSLATGDLASARHVIQRLSDHMPGDDSLAGERAILDALYGENLPQSLTTLGELVKKSPSNGTWRHGLALAKLKNGDAIGALSLIEEAAYDWKQSTPRNQAIYVAVLGSNGQRETARRFAHQVNVEKLREPERQLIEPWLL